MLSVEESSDYLSLSFSLDLSLSFPFSSLVPFFFPFLFALSFISSDTKPCVLIVSRPALNIYRMAAFQGDELGYWGYMSEETTDEQAFGCRTE